MLKKVFQTATVSLCTAFLVAFAAVLLAVACGNRISISFETFGGTPIGTISQKAGTAIDPPADPEKEGYLFTGWYLDKNFEGDAQTLPATMPGKNAVYYAKFEEIPPQYVLTLDAKGGNLQTSSYTVAEGADLSSLLGNAVPQKEGVAFGGWEYEGGDPPAFMPRRNVTLTARYISGYRVEIYLQSAEREDEYDKETSYGSGFEGETITPELPFYEHFVFDEERSTARTLTLGAQENAFCFYFNRERITIRYFANRENALPAERQTELCYGGAETLESAAAEGYLFLGWSDRAEGTALYAAGERLNLYTDTEFYAVWAKLYADGFGSDAVLAVSEYENADGMRDVWLLRGEERIAGKMDGGGFFRAGETEGRLDEHGAFLLSDGGCYLGYELSSSSADEAYGVLTLDFASGTAVFTRDDVVSEGTYTPVYNEREARYTGEYRFEGENEAFFFRLGDGTFLRKGEEAGEYVLGEMSSEKWVFSFQTVLVLDGYGGARLTRNGVASEGAYCGGEEGVWRLMLESGETLRFITCEVSATGTGSISVFLPADEEQIP